MDKWEGVVAVVTGASAGIGRAVAIKLAEHGLIVAALARRQNKLEELANLFKGRGRIIAIKCDITKQDEMEDVLRRVEAQQGRIRVLINNAGIAHYSNFSDLNLDLWRKMVDLNLFGMFYGIKYVMDSVKKSDPGLIQIINVNSIAGQYQLEDVNIAPYQMTKYGVTILTRALIKQIAKDGLNIRVSSLSPGVVKTEILEAGNWDTNLYEMHPQLQPEDLADSVISILSAPPNVIISELTIKPKGEIM